MNFKMHKDMVWLGELLQTEFRGHTLTLIEIRDRAGWDLSYVAGLVSLLAERGVLAEVDQRARVNEPIDPARAWTVL